MKCPDCMALITTDASHCPDCGLRFSVLDVGPTVGLVSDDRLRDRLTSSQTRVPASDERADSPPNNPRDHD